MKKGIIGKKLGMTQIFAENGAVIPVTVIEAGPCVVVQKKTTENDGYNAIQVGYEDVKASHVSNPVKGHFAKANSQWKELNGQQVLVVFHGPHSYISSSWYETKGAVPTWNYTAVHVNGTLQLLQDEALIDECLRDLIKKYEAPDSTYRYEEVDEKYIASLKKGIVAFKIDIEKMEGKAKLSQNHSGDRQQLVKKKKKNNDDAESLAIAKLMKQNKD